MTLACSELSLALTALQTASQIRYASSDYLAGYLTSVCMHLFRSAPVPVQEALIVELRCTAERLHAEALRAEVDSILGPGTYAGLTNPNKGASIKT